jgi:amino acid transporter
MTEFPATERPDNIEQYGYKQELHRSLSFADLLVYGLVFMVPIAPFGIFGSVFQGAGGMVALAYAIGMVAMMFTALSYSQMAQAFPMAGSVYTYAGRGIAAPVGFLAGWMILLDYVLVPALLYLIAAIAMNSLVSSIPVWVWLIGFVILNTVVNYMGIEMTAKVNKIMLAAELVVLAIFIVIGIVALAQGKGRGFDFSPVYNADTFSWPLVFGAVSIAVLSFLGFDGIATLSEEAKGGRRSAGIAMISGLVLVALFFVTQTWLAAMLVPNVEAFPEEEAGNAFFSIVASVSSQGWGIAFLAMNALAVGIANAVAAQSATSRVLFSMSRDGRLPAFLSHVNPRTKVPERAILLVAGLTLIAGLFFVGQISLISSLVNFGALTAFLLLHVSVVSHYAVRRRSGNVLLHWVVPIAGFLIIGYVLWNAEANAKIGGLVWLVIGVLVLLYYRSRGVGIRPEHAYAAEERA